MENDLLDKIATYVRKYCKAHFPEELMYHNIHHIQQVVDYVDEIAPHEGFSDEEHEIALIAAWFHDIGIAEDFANHEALSAKYAEEYLKKLKYPKESIEKVKVAILATKITTEPLEKIGYALRDADSLHLGKLDFFVRMMALREEMRLQLDAEVSEQEILNASIVFYRDHHYYTKYAQRVYTDKKLANLSRLEEMYKKYFGKLPEEKSSSSGKKQKTTR